MRNLIFSAALLFITTFSSVHSQSIIRLDQLDMTKSTNGYNRPIKINLSTDGNALRMKGVTYPYGVGVHAPSQIDIKTNGATRFFALIGIDDEVDPTFRPEDHGIAEYKILKDGTTEVMKGTLKRNDAKAVSIDLDISGYKFISLVVNTAGQDWADHVDWVNAGFEYTGTAPYTVTNADMLNPPGIQMESARIFYSQPNVKMMHRFATNSPQAVLSVENLPAGLAFNSKRNLVEGKISTKGTYNYILKAKDNENENSFTITVHVSDSLISPTPLMGWMSWNIFQDKINETNLKQVADLLVSTGLKDVGFNYVLIDDHWHGKSRDANGFLDCDRTKFPAGMKSLVDYIHSKGLKAGIYSDAAENTCGGEIGSLNYEEKDAQQYASWGFDFLKYDYCYAPKDVNVAKIRYKKMSDALKKTGRPFYFNICEWGDRKPWLWAAEAGGHAWRVSWDSRDTWDHGAYDGGHCGVIQAIDVMKPLALYAGPNQFNDLDMMCVGLYGTGKPSSANGAAGMNDTEYRSQFSLWSMFASPLLISFDLSKMNAATKAILTNKEVLAINQDPMGQQASCIYSENGKEVFMKDLENGDVAIALLNRNATTQTITVRLEDLFLSGEYTVRDLWKQENTGIVNSEISTLVNSHETKLYRLSKRSETGTKHFKKKDALEIYSENGKVEINITEPINDQIHLTINDLTGKIIFSSVISDNKINVNLNNFPSSIYLVKINNGNEEVYQKFILRK